MEVDDIVLALRPMQSELSVLQRADGSARVQHGGTSVLCAVYGPADVKASKERCDKATLEVIVKPLSGQTCPRDRLLESLVSSCCEAAILLSLHPHTAISLVLQVESDDGSLLSVLVHACCLALLDACIPLSSPLPSLSVAFTAQEEMLTDPTTEQEKGTTSRLTFVTDSASGNVVTSYTVGAYSRDQLRQAMSAAVANTKTVTDFYRDAIRKKLSKDAKFAEPMEDA